MDKSEYVEKMETKLQNHQVYQPLNKDPTNEVKEQIKSIYKDLVNKNIITESCYKFMKPNGTQLARMYGQPKIHKEGYPLREIVDGTGSVTHNTDKFIGGIIKHYTTDNEFTLKNSADYVERWKDIHVGEDETLQFTHIWYKQRVTDRIYSYMVHAVTQ